MEMEKRSANKVLARLGTSRSTDIPAPAAMKTKAASVPSIT
jgi:hypothetical protein